VGSTTGSGLAQAVSWAEIIAALTVWQIPHDAGIDPAPAGPVGAENASHLGISAEEATGHCPRVAVVAGLHAGGRAMMLLHETRNGRSHGESRPLSWVGDTGIEPVTSSV
jgi:hypothetical protein